MSLRVSVESMRPHARVESYYYMLVVHGPMYRTAVPYYGTTTVFHGSVIKVIPLRNSYCTFKRSSKFLFPCSMRAFYTATRTTSLCAHMSAFPTKKPTPTPYFAHFLKEILRMRAHSREGNIKGNCPHRGGVISIAPKSKIAKNRIIIKNGPC